MDSDNLFKLTACLMIALVITLPFSISSAHAISYVVDYYDSSKGLHGSDGIKNFAASKSDSLNLDVQVYYEDNFELDLGQIVLYIPDKMDHEDDSFPADSCTILPGISPEPQYQCSFSMGSYDQISEDVLNSMPTEFKVFLYDDPETKNKVAKLPPQDNEYIEFYFDDLGPAISNIIVDDTVVVDGYVGGSSDVTGTFELQDSVSESITDKCSGAGKVKIFTVDENDYPSTTDLLVVTEMNPMEEVCKYYGAFSFSASSLPEGTTKVCLAAYDNVGNPKNEAGDEIKVVAKEGDCFSLTVDSTKPQFVLVELLDENDRVMNYLPPVEKTVKVRVNHSDNLAGLKKAVIISDDPSLNTPLDEEMTCPEKGTEGYCYHQFKVTLTEDTTGLSVGINLTDNAGNWEFQTSNFALQVDATDPSMSSLRTAVSRNEEYYAGPIGNTVVFDISDTGAGVPIDNENIDLTELGALFDISSLEIENFCVGSEQSMSCILENINLTDNAKTEAEQHDPFMEQTIKITATDAVGFPIEQEGNINFDVIPPEIVDRDESFSTFDFYAGYPITIINSDSDIPVLESGKTVSMKIRFKDGGAGLMDDAGLMSTVIANLTDIGLDPAGNQAEECVFNEEKDVWICTWTLALMKQTDEFKVGLPKVCDTAGNCADLGERSEFAIQYNAPPGEEDHVVYAEGLVVAQGDLNASNMWELEISDNSPSPKKINRKTHFLASDMHFMLNLRSTNEGTVLINSLGGGSDDANANKIKIVRIGLDPVDPNIACKGNDMEFVSVGYPEIIPAGLMNDISWNSEEDAFESEDLFMLFQLEPTVDLPNYDLQDINCSFIVVSQRGAVSTETSESLGVNITRQNIDVNFKIPLYNSPVGELGPQIAKEIENVQKSTLVQWKGLEVAEKWLRDAQKICQILDTYYKIIRLTSIFRDIQAFQCNVARAAQTGYSEKICAKVRESNEYKEKMKEGYHNVYKENWDICKVINCQMDVIDWLGDAEESIFSKPEETGSISNAQKDFADTLGKNKEFQNWWWAQTEKGEGPTADPSLSPSQQKFGKGLGGTGLSYWAEVSNPQNSLLMSVYKLCLPGVIYNLQKARVIECVYINCLARIQDGGSTPARCIAERSYAWCAFVLGEAFAFLPFNTIDNLLNSLAGAISSWENLAMAAVKGVACDACCGSDWCVTCWGCTALTLIDSIADVSCDLGINPPGQKTCKPVWKDVFEKDQDQKDAENVCKDALDYDPTPYKEERHPTPEEPEEDPEVDGGEPTTPELDAGEEPPVDGDEPPVDGDEPPAEEPPAE
ncbi:hypothetical protein ACFL0W_03650 [Nanoarchaeota archaeon]